MGEILAEAKTKKCIGCNEVKPLTEFYRAKQYYQSRCKPCNIAQVNDYRRNNPDKARKYREGYRVRNKNTPRLKAAQIHEGMVSRSKKKGFEYPEWTREEIAKAIQGCCAITGIPFEFDQSRFTKSPWTPVPDRIDSSKGYTRDNVMWVCHMYNSLKQEYTAAEVEIFLAAILSKRAQVVAKGTRSIPRQTSPGDF